MSHSFQVGDFVRTSKGKVGVIQYVEKVEIGYHIGDRWVVLRNFYSQCAAELIGEETDLQWKYPNHFITSKRVPNQVLLGNKSFPIWSDKLTKLDNLTIKLGGIFGHYSLTLPVEDSKTFIEILSRNKTWFSIE